MSMTTSTSNVREITPILQFIFRHGITIEQAGTDMWRIKTANASSSGNISGLDFTRTYPSFDLAVQAILNVVGKSASTAAA
jgi:hypothetical protein